MIEMTKQEFKEKTALSNNESIVCDYRNSWNEKIEKHAKAAEIVLDWTIIINE